MKLLLLLAFALSSVSFGNQNQETGAQRIAKHYRTVCRCFCGHIGSEGASRLKQLRPQGLQSLNTYEWGIDFDASSGSRGTLGGAVSNDFECPRSGDTCTGYDDRGAMDRDTYHGCTGPVWALKLPE